MSSTMAKMMFIAAGYAVSSSGLVVINKWAVMKWPYSSTLTFTQLTASWLLAFIIGTIGIVKVDKLDWGKIKAFSPACLIFFVVLACNMKLLQYANVDTFIVLRSLVPLATCFVERVTIGTPLPGPKVLACLVLIVIGAVGYVQADREFSLTAYTWGFAYVFTMVIDTVLVKRVVTKVELTPWGLVLYNNLIASVLYPFFAMATGEASQIPVALAELLAPGSESALAVGASCVFGIAISYFGLNARKALTATAFSVLGVVCKFATVLVNVSVWDHHASPVGIFWLLVCISGGILYQQAMKNASFTPAKPEAEPVKYDPVDTEANAADAAETKDRD
ncbi:GDP-mannose transporter GONST3 [Hondaea fermentalgiana]|uniref:GDP-mannose transporter GONST3 n=1 Tax=Hondaea fermentalgiana TaxID=2315210 RepID=A0A2R5GMG7_9STRA|nr:GDP-mannose transporter GONST3 [Hondaea fermentalgiana]|eukprot:GBG29833.1 GDP-mannose transporter GONST3 [Hondaea fermentalgiana]